MTSPFSDGPVLPMDAPPMPVSPHGEATRLRSERTLWERRALVASDAEDELKRAVAQLAGTVSSNYFGDCLEGRQFSAALTRAVAGLTSELTEHAMVAGRLSVRCHHAAAAIESTDRDGAADIEI